MESKLCEIAKPAPIQSPAEDVLYRHVALEDVRSHYEDQVDKTPDGNLEVRESGRPETGRTSEVMTQFYTISYLALFAILGTLSRLGLQAIAYYAGTPTEKPKVSVQGEGNSSGNSSKAVDLAGVKKAHLAIKKTIPLYIGLVTGFCGSFTSFSSFIRDSFLALSSDLPIGLDSTLSRNGGYSLMVVLAVIIVTVASSITALHMGAHLAIFLEPYLPNLSLTIIRRIFDRVALLLAWGSWIGAIVLAICPPDRELDSPEVWRGRAVFAIVFAPLGCLCRFYASLYLNEKLPSFPLGTFTVNILGTVVLGMCRDLQHKPLGQLIGCQLLQGIEDGFCGCSTTVNTWVSELAALRRSHAYKYGAASVVAGLCFLLVIMGSLRWTQGFLEQLCVH